MPKKRNRTVTFALPAPGPSGISSTVGPRRLAVWCHRFVHVVPLSNEKYTPETPTPGVNGQVLSAPALQASMSISSFEPATRMFG